MNPLTQIRQLKKINEAELKLGVAGEKKSWHDVYKDSAWVFVGGLSFELTEGDVIAVFSQYGEIVNINLVRDPKTGKSRGFAFICFEDQRSTVLSVDNLNGIKLVGRTVRVDHVANYKPPKEKDETDELTRLIYERGCGPEINLAALEKEAAKREARKVNDKQDEKRNFHKQRHGDRNYREHGIKAEYDADGDVKQVKMKLEYDDDGDILPTRPPVEGVKEEKIDYDSDGDIKRPVRRPGGDFDNAVSSKRRSIDHRRHGNTVDYDGDRSSMHNRQEDDKHRDRGHRRHHHRHNSSHRH